VPPDGGAAEPIGSGLRDQDAQVERVVQGETSELSRRQLGVK